MVLRLAAFGALDDREGGFFPFRNSILDCECDCCSPLVLVRLGPLLRGEFDSGYRSWTFGRLLPPATVAAAGAGWGGELEAAHCNSASALEAVEAGSRRVARSPEVDIAPRSWRARVSVSLAFCSW